MNRLSCAAAALAFAAMPALAQEASDMTDTSATAADAIEAQAETGEPAPVPTPPIVPSEAAQANNGPAMTLTQQAASEDPYIWMEEVEGEKALAWVREQNERSLELLQSDPRYDDLKAAALDIVNSNERIPYGSIRNGKVYNFWQDETNVRGLWRRTSLESYATETPEWETVLDFDKLAADEDKNWVFKGSDCFAETGESNYTCMVTLSDGGKDAAVQREFDLTTKTFVEGGFTLPEAKSGTTWLDRDTLLVGTDWNSDGSTLTESGYPSVVKRWTRGTPLESAETLYTADKTDVGLWPFTLELDDGSRIAGAVESDTFFTSTYWWFPEGEADPVKLPVPPKATPQGIYKGQLLLTLEQDWSPDGQDVSFKSGDLIAFEMAAFMESRALPPVALVFQPNEKQAVGGVSISRDAALLSISDNVRGRILTLAPGEDGWSTTPVDLPQNGSVGIAFADKDEETVFINYEGYLTPDSLLRYMPAAGEVETLKTLPAKFDAEGLTVQQFEATSKDGTKIPYFVVHRDDIELNGETPTLLYGYGGFQISLTPGYSALNGKMWMEKGGAYVVANIRGGGEFGPEWHQAGLKTKRQVVYDDFIAVGEDLIDRGITSTPRLGIMGGSNGGLLMGVMLTQRPDLWNAVVVQVPLLDMLRYHLLLAGASWVDEYGSPDIAEERAWLETMSPYANFDADADYPTPFFVTSTKDDRVHPAHARKMAKLFQAADKPFLYYENIDGGHSAAANLQETAKRKALEFTYLMRQLMDDPAAAAADAVDAGEAAPDMQEPATE